MKTLAVLILLLIKKAYAGTGNANDAEMGVLFIVSILAMILIILVLIKFFQKKLFEYREKKIFGNKIEELSGFEDENHNDEIEYFSSKYYDLDY